MFAAIVPLSGPNFSGFRRRFRLRRASLIAGYRGPDRRRIRRDFGDLSVPVLGDSLPSFHARRARTHTRGLCASLGAPASLPLSPSLCLRRCACVWLIGRGRRELDWLMMAVAHTHTHRTDGSLATCLTPALDAAIAMASAWNPTDAATRRPTPKFGDHFPKIAGGHEPRKVVTSDRRVASCI